ncbi:MAG: SEC-C domain-containing protein, partial [Oscillospiraceae bacterium]|nr:SEC-C domain-containing protein [Oscillospiraceae bacterium]
DHFMTWVLRDEDLDYDEKNIDDVTRESVAKIIEDRMKEIYAAKEAEFGGQMIRELERVFLLKVVDTKWMNHIDDMSELKKGIGLRAFGQKNPVVEYRYEGFEMFDAMVDSIREDTVRMLLTVKIQKNAAPIQREQVAKPDAPNAGSTRVVKNKAEDNELCPCGSGLKYKKCCGLKEQQ